MFQYGCWGELSFFAVFQYIKELTWLRMHKIIEHIFLLVWLESIVYFLPPTCEVPVSSPIYVEKSV